MGTISALQVPHCFRFHACRALMWYYVEDEKLTMLRLTSRAMTEFTIQRLPSTQLILNFSTMAIRFILDVKVLILLMYTVRRTLLPLRDASRRLSTALILIHPDSL